MEPARVAVLEPARTTLSTPIWSSPISAASSTTHGERSKGRPRDRLRLSVSGRRPAVPNPLSCRGRPRTVPNDPGGPRRYRRGPRRCDVCSLTYWTASATFAAILVPASSADGRRSTAPSDETRRLDVLPRQLRPAVDASQPTDKTLPVDREISTPAHDHDERHGRSLADLHAPVPTNLLGPCHRVEDHRPVKLQRRPRERRQHLMRHPRRPKLTRDCTPAQRCFDDVLDRRLRHPQLVASSRLTVDLPVPGRPLTTTTAATPQRRR